MVNPSLPDPKGVTGGNQGLPVVTSVTPDLPMVNQVLPLVSDEDKISGELEKGERLPEVKDRLPEVKVKGTGLDRNIRRFDWQKKRRFLRMAKRFWPNVTLCCAACGISDSTFYTHKKLDPIFAHKIAEIDRGTTDRIEGVLAEQAVYPKGFLDRMAYLRAHRPELYDRAKVVKIEGYKMSQEESTRRLGGLGEAIDAEIVKSYQDRKARLEAKRNEGAIIRELSEGKEEGMAG